jgi:hypothetical protein
VEVVDMPASFAVFIIPFMVVIYVQYFLAFGTAYRLTKNGGDNGVSLFGWMFLLGIASVIPGLGIYLWVRYRNI